MFTMTKARARFEKRFPEFQNKAKAYFADFKPEAKDEAAANSLFLIRQPLESTTSRNPLPSRCLRYHEIVVM